MNKIPSRQDWCVNSYNSNILKDKQRLVDQYILYMLNRTQSMFEYDGLPDTIPSKDLEFLLQMNGNATITKVNEKLYAFRGGLGGIPNTYYHPTISVVSNPYLNFNATLTIDKDCIVVLNDSLYMGLSEMFNKYANLLAETDISIRMATINNRIEQLLVADNDSTKASAELVLKKIEDGKELGIIGSNSFFKGLTSVPYKNTTSNIKDLIELQQYIKSSWFIDLGLNANYNMKRESINESESAMNDDELLPLVDEMLKQRQIGLDKVNAMYGTSISVKLSSSWKKIREEITNADEIQKAQIEQLTQISEVEETGEEEYNNED